jgi:hypothetical protein
MRHINMRRRQRRWIVLAVLTCGTSYALGLGCLQTIMAILGASFF